MTAEADVRVLVADDNREIRSALRLALLEVSGQQAATSGWAGTSADATCKIFEAASAAEALQFLDDEDMDLVLLDWELPGLEPSRTVAEMRGRSPECRVIAMSGRLEARDSSLRAGADYFVGKNDPPNALLGLLTSLWTAQTA